MPLFSSQATFPYTHEQRLLLALARNHFDEEDKPSIQELISQTTDWNAFIQESLTQDIAPLISHNVDCYFQESVPLDVLKRLQTTFRENSWRTLALTGETLRILAALDAENIFAVPLKGPILATMLYHDIALRVTHDIDILVREEEFARAVAVIRKVGFSERDDMPHTYHQTLFNPRSKVRVELHWNLSLPEIVGQSFVKKALTRTRTIEFSGRQVHVLSDEDLFLYVCIHGHSHNWVRLKWLCDLAELIRENPIEDWFSSLKTVAPEYKRIICFASALAYNLLGSEIPKNISWDANSDYGVIKLSETIIPKFFERSTQNYTIDEKLLFKTLRSRSENLHEVFSTIRYYLTPNEQDKHIISLPRYLGFLYYPIRFFRLLIRYRATLVSRLVYFLKVFISGLRNRNTQSL